jgi:hypothetical protein
MENLAPTPRIQLNGTLIVPEVTVWNVENRMGFRHRKTKAEVKAEGPKQRKELDPFQKQAESVRAGLYNIFRGLAIKAGSNYYVVPEVLDEVKARIQAFHASCEGFNSLAQAEGSPWRIEHIFVEALAVGPALRAYVLRQASETVGLLYQYLQDGDLKAATKTLGEASKLSHVFANGDKYAFDEALRQATNATKLLRKEESETRRKEIIGRLNLDSLSFLEDRYATHVHTSEEATVNAQSQ